MEEPGLSTDVLGIDLSKPQFHLVVAPSAWDEAVKVNQTKYTYSSNDLTAQATNPCYRLFGGHNKRIATPPFLSGSDWGVIRDCSEVPILEMTQTKSGHPNALQAHHMIPNFADHAANLTIFALFEDDPEPAA